MKIRLGTRASKLALWQAHMVAHKLDSVGCQVDIVSISTTGDRRTDVSLAEIGGKALFVKEIEEALLNREIDIAVHSLKDVPSIIDDRFSLAAYVERADPRDAWISRDGVDLMDLAAGSRVGTSSPRRRAQILARRNDLDVVSIRGNVDTRLEKIRAGEFSATLLAAAGLARLGRQSEATRFLDRTEMVPAAGQGIITVEVLADREDLAPVAALIDDAQARAEALTERGILQRFGKLLDCYSCIAVNAALVGDEMTVHSFVSDLEARSVIRLEHHGAADLLVDAVHVDILAHGAMELLERSSS
jgi:hydroxymethylbilane synthase